MKSKYTSMDTGLLIQLLLFVTLIILLILSIFWSYLLMFVQILTGITLIIMGINNIRLFKRKYMTAIYIAFGILIILSAAWSYFFG